MMIIYCFFFSPADISFLRSRSEERRVGKEENLTYHQSRHSFGTFLISADIPIESIAKMMGHSNIRTTQGYARITDEKISKDMDKLMERRKEISAGEKKKQ